MTAQPTLVSLLTIEHLRAVDFWGRVDVRGPEECWEWTKGCNQIGYGSLHIPRSVTGLGRAIAIYAHRVAYSLHTGEMVGPETVIDHRCYNRPCCNPAHLDGTTQLVNVRRARKPMRKADPFPRSDGSTRWQVRYYEVQDGKRRHLSRSFDDKAEAEAFARSRRAG